MKKWTVKKILKEIILTLLILFVVSMVLNYIRQPKVDDQLHDQHFRLIDGSSITLRQEGKPTVIHFWATWCPTCKLEAPNIERLLGDEVHLVTVAVNSGDSQKLQQFMKQEGYHYPVVNDQQGKLAKAFDVEAFPTTFIYDSRGKLRFSEVGYSTTLGLKARLELIK